MSWIETIAYEDANTKLKALYDRVKGPDNNVDNIMMMHSLRLTPWKVIWQYINMFCITVTTP